MNKSKIIITLFAAFLFTTLLNARADDGILAGAFMRMGLGARANAMGNAYTGVAEGTVAAYYNPAGIPFLETRQVMLSYRFLSLDRNFNYIGFSRI